MIVPYFGRWFCGNGGFKSTGRCGSFWSGDAKIPQKDRRRHTFVSQMQALGVSMETILGLVGHADSDMSEHYLHLQESVRQDAIGRFAKRFADAEAA